MYPLDKSEPHFRVYLPSFMSSTLWYRKFSAPCEQKKNLFANKCFLVLMSTMREARPKLSSNVTLSIAFTRVNFKWVATCERSEHKKYFFLDDVYEIICMTLVFTGCLNKFCKGILKKLYQSLITRKFFERLFTFREV